jgi:aminoglycoside phosphotransferase
MDGFHSFFDEPISPEYYFINAPHCRTRREAALHFLKSKTFLEPEPPLKGYEKVIHQIMHPASMDSIIDRQVVLQTDNTILKSVRIPNSNLFAEKEALELVKANTSIPVPRAYDYYKTEEFEHLVIEKMPGITLEEAWLTLEVHEREEIADQVVAFLDEMRKLHSPHIEAALLDRKPLRSGLVGAADFNHERFKQFPSNEHISAYIQARIDGLHPEPNVFTHSDLDWSNILIVDKKVSAIIDWESSGYFPAYWEWVSLKWAEENLNGGEWYRLLTSRLEPSKSSQWNGTLQLEQLYRALELHTDWGLTPEDREENRIRGWAKVTEMLIGAAPLVDHTVASSKSPFWVERYNETSSSHDNGEPNEGET